jgi:membrane associated rhomboid family serine protease
MNRFAEELKYAFNRPDNGLIRIILINLIVYAVLIVLRVVLNLSGAGEVFSLILQQLMLPSDFGTFLTKPWTLVTYMFTHEDFFHILFNMLFLYWFGQLIMDYLGSKKFVNIFVLGGLAGGVFYMLIYNLLPFYQSQVNVSVLLGASAGVSAIIVAAATLVPNHSFVLLFIGPVKIKYIAIFYVIFKSFAGLDGPNAGGELAHLGGALIGYLYVQQLRKGNDIGGWISGFFGWVKGIFQPKPKIRVSHKQSTYTASQNSYSRTAERHRNATANTNATASRTPVEQDEIDTILDKISEKGYESLSKEEKQKLFNASKR